MSQRQPCKQTHTRFDVSKIEHDLDADEELARLLKAATKQSTNDEYVSRLNTLEKFLAAHRGTPAAHAHTCTREEWILYLSNRNRQGMGPANGVHCALLQLHRSMGMTPSFLETKLFWKLMDGASSNFVRRPKGVI